MSRWILTVILLLVSAPLSIAAEEKQDEDILTPPLKKDLVLWFGFDIADKRKITDKSGNNNHGCPQGSPKWAASSGNRNGVMLLHARSPLVPLDKYKGIDLDGNSFTISAWISPNRTSYPMHLIYRHAATHAQGQCLDIKIQPNRGMIFSFYEADLIAEISDITGVWSHFVFTYDKTTGKKCIYQNGKLLAEKVEKVSLKNTNDTTIWMGYTWDGGLDDVMIWTRNLPAGQVKQLYTLTGGK